MFLFLPAGTFDYWQAWLFIGILFGSMFIAGIMLMIRQPELLRKRLDAKEKQGEQMEQELSGALDAQTERGAAASLLALLPEEFTASDLIKLRARKGQSVKGSSISMVLNRWRNTNRIEKISETTWRKL